MKTVCLFGIYDPSYSRNSTLIKGFIENGWEVVECNVPANSGRFLKYWKLWKKGRALRSRNFNLVIAAYPAQPITWLGRLIFGPNIIFDGFLSFYDSNVFDRKVYGPRSLGGLRDYFLDWLSVKVSRFTLLDTDCHIDYFVETFKLSREKFIRSLIGAHDGIYAPQPKPEGKVFNVEFHGMYIPLQGIEYILEAANLLRNEKDIHFTIIGSGQTFKQNKKLAEDLKLTNVTIVPRVPEKDVPGYIAAADVCLGIFGNTEKTLRVIPNKVYQYAAMAKPIITAESKGIREVFTDRKDVYLVKHADPKGIADAIRILKKDGQLRERLALAAREVYLEKLTPQKMVAQIIKDLPLPEYKIAVLPPTGKADYLANTVLDGLVEMGDKVEFRTTASPTPFPISKYVLSDEDMVEYARKADLIILTWGKDSTKYALAEKINRWDKTVYVDGSEVGKDNRFNKEIEEKLIDMTYEGNGKIDAILLEKCKKYFRREKPYIQGILPFPFGIERRYRAYKDGIKKNIDVVCIFGQEDYPKMRKEVRHIVEEFGKESGLVTATQKTKGFTFSDTKKTAGRDEFYNLLARAKVGVSVGGGGYDTARFWEILGNNCALLTEKIDIQIPGNFNYKRVTEFSDLADFRTKLEELKHRMPELDRKEYDAIIKEHSTRARVEYLLKNSL